MSGAQGTRTGQDTRRLRIRNAALGLATVAIAFYLGFIALLVFRSHH
ncbi:MAG TPA: hypothetical protein VN815_08220 [Steroidobacteraceae bacterium]|nr:hypothetical protein [Steroidobacteraceae bacterium]